LYWSVITLAPILLGTAISVSGHVSALPIVMATSQLSVIKFFLVLLQFFITALFFALLYYCIPNAAVRFRDALLGGALAMVLFEVTKRLLVIYIKKFTHYKFMYGAVAAMPIFLIWLYFVWLILLFGAQVAHMAGLFAQGKRSV
jgi:membrane protein